jgi:High potential iron-sulfur protein
MNRDKISRRRILGASLLGLPAIPVMVETAFGQAAAKPAAPAAKPAAPAAAKPAAGAAAAPAAAGALPLLNPTEPAAKALGYIEDATKVDAKANPTYKPGQTCANCLQWADKNRKAPTAKCNLFPGKLVKGPGWCKVWVKAPGTA